MKRRWRSLGDFDSGYLKDMLPAAAAGGQLTAGSLLKYIYIYINATIIRGFRLWPRREGGRSTINTDLSMGIKNKSEKYARISQV